MEPIINTLNTEEWENIKKNKIIANCLGYVSGFHWEKVFVEYWNIVKRGHHKDKKIHNFNKGNFERGQSFKKFALDLFEKVIANQ